MKLSFYLLGSVLVATSVVAAPTSHIGLSRRVERRTRTLRDTTMRSRDSSNATTKVRPSTCTKPSIKYSKNWSGLAHTSPPSSEAFNTVSAKFTVPTPSVPSGVAATNGEYSASAWVGIDGVTYRTAILQTGIDLTVSTSGAVSFDAWYEWYPDHAYDFNLTISAGDVISLFVNATTTTSGSATIENLTTGKAATQSLTSSSALSGENAEWMVEDFKKNNALNAFADFGNVTFTDCVASTFSSSEGVTDATVMDLENTNHEVLTEVTLISDSSFKISYTATGAHINTRSGQGPGSGGRGVGNGGGFGSRKSGNSGFEFKRSIAVLWGRLSTSGGL